MHCFNNIIKDSVHVFKNKTSTFDLNGTLAPNVIEACQKSKILSTAYGTDYEESPPW